MANLTIDQAVAKIRQRLADTSSTSTSQRWTEAVILDALADALSGCLTTYASQGGDRFDLEASVTTSASTGSVALTSVLPLLVKQVSVVIDSTTYRLQPKNTMRRGYADLTARTLSVLYVREYALSSTTTHPLVGVGAAEANSWRAFDRWVCIEAATQLAPKDMELPRIEVLKAERDEARATALMRTSTPAGYEMPRPEWSPLYGNISWQMVQPSTIYLTQARW